jgi:molybdenum transport protein
VAWKVSLNILEYCSGIATRTRSLLETAREVAPGIPILTTRKSFPGTKELAIKAVIAGGGSPHRLGLSETILIFKQHTAFLSGAAELAVKLGEMRREVCEKKIIVEVETVDQALDLARGKVDGLQFDKLSPDQMQVAVEQIREINPRIVLLAAGGINENNVAAYAATGVDAIVTTCVYFGKPADIAVQMKPLG